MRVILEVVEGPQAGQRFVFERHEAFVVGRKKNEKVQFRIPDDPYFSRYHMLIEVAPPKCFLRDLGSRNGTRVNGSKVREAELADGDLVRGGHTTMRVHIEEPAAASGAPADGPQAPPATLSTPEPPETGEPEWETQVFGRLQRGSGGLQCQLCKRQAEEAHLAALAETRILAYVCRACRDKHRDAQHPVPNYEKLAVLGRGALGPAYKARRVSTGKVVVLKLLAPEVAAQGGATATFLRQMLLSARLQHARIVPVVELGLAGNDLWIASEYIDGIDGRELARQLGGTVPPADAVAITCQVLEALQYAHGLALVHRDVKPSNVLVSGRPGSYGARLADFGLLRHMDDAGLSGITRKGEARGTIPFMPPEQVLDCRFVKPAGDIYAAGATLYWLLTGEFVHDFEAVDARGERRDPYSIILDDPVVPMRQRSPAIAEALARAIHTALAYEPEDRFATAAEMARALQQAM
jgi:serine/threonine-protein kinase